MPVLALLALLSLPASASSFSSETIEVGGRRRAFSVYVPSGPARGLPAVFLLHGGGVSTVQVRRYTQGRLDALAEKERFLVVYPEGVAHAWNGGIEKLSKTSREDVDDVGFLAAVAERLVKGRGADRRRLYAVGVSNGGSMVHKLACKDAGRWAAAASVAGSFGTEAAASCRPSRPVPILMVHGTADPINAWGGHEIRLLVTTTGSILTAPEAAAKWAALDGCSGVAERSDLPDKDPDDGTRWRLTAWRGCRAGAEVLLYKVLGGGHTWPGAEPAYHVVIGRSSRDVDFEPLLWEFLARHALPGRRAER